MIKQARIILATISVLIFTVAATTYQGSSKRVDINTGAKVVSVSTTAATVGQVLENNKIDFDKDDFITPPIETEVTDNLKIFIEKAFMVNAIVDGLPKHIKVSKGTVNNVKSKVEQMIGIETKLLNGLESDMLIPNMTIELVTSYTETQEELNEVPFEVVYVDNNQLEKGVTQVVTEGVNGTSLSVYELLYEGNQLISKDLVETRIVQAPINNVIENGTKIRGIIAGGVEREIVKTVTMRASAYTADRGDASSITATGERCRVGLVAVDPKFIPLGTWLYIEGYGEARAADTGGMIKGDAIDLYMNTYNEMTSFGRRNVTVHILK